MSALTTSGRPLSELIKAVESFDSDDTARPVLHALAEAGSRLILAGFSSSSAPDGSRWAPLKRPRPGGGPLVKTGAMLSYASAATIRTDEAVFVAPSPKGVHQRGNSRRNLPARPFFPDARRLPPTWEMVLQWAAEDALKLKLP